MEAAELLGLSPGFKFDPDDDELVELFFLPRLLRQQVPLDGIVLEDDPLSAPPWTLLRKHGRKKEAFFFAEGQAVNGKAGSRHKRRTCAGGGSWEGQKVCVDGEKLLVPGSGMEIRWRKYALNFHVDAEKGSTGWVMHEYAVTSPDKLASSSLRLYRIRRGGGGKKRKTEPQDSGGDQGAALAVAPQATAEPEFFSEQYPYASHSVFPPVVVDLVDDADGPELGTSAPPAATSSDHGSSGVTNDLPLLDYILPDDPDDLFPFFGDIVLPEFWLLPGAEPASTFSEQDNPGAMDEFPSADGCAAPAAWTLLLDEGSCASAIDDEFFNFEFPANIDLAGFFTLLEPKACGLQAADGPRFQEEHLL